MILNNIIVKIIIRILAVGALLMTLLPSILHFMNKLPLEKVNSIMAIGMLLWFASGSLWLGRKKKD